MTVRCVCGAREIPDKARYGQIAGSIVHMRDRCADIRTVEIEDPDDSGDKTLGDLVARVRQTRSAKR